MNSIKNKNGPGGICGSLCSPSSEMNFERNPRVQIKFMAPEGFVGRFALRRPK